MNNVNDDNKEKIKVFLLDGNYFTLDKDKYIPKKQMLPNNKQLPPGAILAGDILTNKKYKPHNKDEQYITSIYKGGVECEGDVQKTPKKTSSSYIDTRATNLIYTTKQEANQRIAKKHEEIRTPSGNKMILHWILDIPDTTKHLTSQILNHGSKKRQFIDKYGNEVNGLLQLHFDRIENDKFKQLKSFYFKSMACHGGYYDDNTNVFKKIQEKLQKCKKNAPKCFVRLAKKEYPLLIQSKYDNKKKLAGITQVPLNTPEQKDVPDVIYEDVKTNKDKYFDYYMVEKDKIYKVPHELVHNRVALLDGTYMEKHKMPKGKMMEVSKSWDKKWEELLEQGKIVELTPEKQKEEFKEWEEYKKQLEKEKKSKLDKELKDTNNQPIRKPETTQCCNLF